MRFVGGRLHTRESDGDPGIWSTHIGHTPPLNLKLQNLHNPTRGREGLITWVNHSTQLKGAPGVYYFFIVHTILCRVNQICHCNPSCGGSDPSHVRCGSSVFGPRSTAVQTPPWASWGGTFGAVLPNLKGLRILR